MVAIFDRNNASRLSFKQYNINKENNEINSVKINFIKLSIVWYYKNQKKISKF